MRILAVLALTVASGDALGQIYPSTTIDASEPAPAAPIAPVPEAAPPALAPDAIPAPATAPRIPEAAAANRSPASGASQPRAPENPGALPATNAELSKTPPASADAGKGLKTATVTDISVQFVAMKPAYVMSSNLVGTSVYNNQNEVLGTIRDLAIDSDKLAGIVVNVGGFLGLGESYIVLDPSAVVVTQKDGVWRAYVNTSRDNLKSAPKFTYAKSG